MLVHDIPDVQQWTLSLAAARHAVTWAYKYACRDNTFKSLYLCCFFHMPDDYLVLWLEHNETTCHYQSVIAAFQQGKYPIIFDDTTSASCLLISYKTSLIAFISFPMTTCPRNYLFLVADCFHYCWWGIAIKIKILQVGKSHDKLRKFRKDRHDLQQPEDSSQAFSGDTSELQSCNLHELLQTAKQYSSDSKLFLFPPQPPNKKGTQRRSLGLKYQRSSMAWHGPDSARAQHTAETCAHR